MTETGLRHKALLAPMRAAMYDWTADGVQSALNTVFAADAQVQLGFPFESLDGGRGWYGDALAPLAQAWPDLERRDFIVTAGRTQEGHDWVGCAGNYVGTFTRPWLGILPTGMATAMRFHEFFRIVDDRVVEVQAVWDLPSVMMQADLWPMGPSLGREWTVPGPSSHDGLSLMGSDGAQSQRSLDVVSAMLADMGRHPTEPVEAMRLERYWHPKFTWYGPGGIGTSRGIKGFRDFHQIPFLKALPDRGGDGYRGTSHFWGDGAYVSVTGWPNMSMTVTGDGWLGIAPANQAITMRSLDFWRLEGDLIRENWVLVDLLHVWDQLGVDVLARMRELAARRHPN